MKRWTEAAARKWYAKFPYLLGCNYTPRTAINQLEMWQADTFDPRTIDEELRWAAGLGMNSLRVFLHDLAWKQDPKGFLERLDHFLAIADGHGIGAMLVFFDSCWHPVPRAGKQPDPEPGVHNSGWLQSPGVEALRDEKKFAKLKAYVTAVVRAFGADARVHCWDVWNEPDNNNANSRGPRDIADKGPIVAKLLPLAFEWIRAARPSQPLTAGLWNGDWSCDSTLRPWERVMLENSDVISFHHYGRADHLDARLTHLARFSRPILCTEYLNRGGGNTFQTQLPVFKRHNAGAYNWGLVKGKTQTHLPWDSWQQSWKYAEQDPTPWHHEVFHADGRPYAAEEIRALRTFAGKR